ncbi:guanylate cyclase [Paenibacillus sp. NAIST15-1]|nr:guanylate cyclase [Paenibacillus sp. NAIST15-1]
MPETIQQSARDWQEDWKQVEAHRHAKNLFNCPIRKLHTMHGMIEIENDTERLAYWMQEYKNLQESYESLELMHKEQKNRADSLLMLIKDVSELISWKHRIQKDGVEEALKLIYKWLIDNPVNKAVTTEKN